MYTVYLYIMAILLVAIVFLICILVGEAIASGLKELF